MPVKKFVKKNDVAAEVAFGAAPAAADVPAESDRQDAQADSDRPSLPRLEVDDKSPIIQQALNFAKEHSLVSFGKKQKCSPRRLVLHVLRHLTQPYGYRWKIVPENNFAFDIVDMAWTHSENKIYPTIGRVFVCPLQHGVESGINIYFYPKFVLDPEQNPRQQPTVNTEFLERVHATVGKDVEPFAFWTNGYAWLPLVKATEEDEDNRLDVRINETTEGPKYEDNITRILVQNLRRLRTTWIIVQQFKKRMPKVDKELNLPLLRQDIGRIVSPRPLTGEPRPLRQPRQPRVARN